MRTFESVRRGGGSEEFEKLCYNEVGSGLIFNKLASQATNDADRQRYFYSR